MIGKNAIEKLNNCSYAKKEIQSMRKTQSPNYLGYVN